VAHALHMLPHGRHNLLRCRPLQELTIQLCGQLLPPDKAAAMVDRLRGKQQTAWHKVGLCCQRRSRAARAAATRNARCGSS
jgi:hypothetical protein